MEKILGIDLGSNSVGWTIRNTSERNNQFVDKGVLTFDKGVGEIKGIEIPMVKQRTDARSKRRNYQAEKYRKWNLLEILIERKMCPLKLQELNQWRKFLKGEGRKYPQSTEFIQWLRFDFNGDGKPDFEEIGFDKHESYYIYRVLAISELDAHKNIFKGNPNILGRVLYQLVQRRGFRGRDDEETKTIMEGSKESGAAGVDVVKPYIYKHKTLGAALYYMQKETHTRIRKRYNLRSDYENELKEICRINEIDDTTYSKLWKAIIWQRPLRSQKGLIGKCIYEKNKSRCPVSHPLYEEYRTWTFINNLKIIMPDGMNKEQYIQDKIAPLFLNSAKDFKIEKIIKVLKKDNGKIESKFRPDTKAVSCSLQYQFSNLLGKDWKEKYGWDNILNNEKEKGKFDCEDIWHILYTYDSKDKLKEFAVNRLNLNEDSATKFSNIKLHQGYASLSISAIKKLIPFLKKGFIYSEAVYMANLKKVLEIDILSKEIIEDFTNAFNEIKKEQIIEKSAITITNSIFSDYISSSNNEIAFVLENDNSEFLENIAKNVLGDKTWETRFNNVERSRILELVTLNYKEFLNKSAATTKESIFLKPMRLHDKIFNFLKIKYNVSDDNLQYLWHPSEQDAYPAVKAENGIKFLGDPQPISKGFKNPMALRTLHELKKLINYLLKINKIDENTRVVVEIARELNDSNKRRAIERYQREREKENVEYKSKIKEIVDEYNLNIDINDKIFVNKYRLWVEQGQTCLYTGKIINCSELFDGSRYDLEHTIPASMSFDNELKNLTIADKHYNTFIKKNNIPFNTPNYNDNVIIDNVEYTAIKPRLKFIEEKVEHFEKLFEEYRNKSSFASTKEIKDSCIQRKHMIGFELDYWKKKLHSFTCEEYKMGWRNSQLKDTQIVTKYALPYLKTVFNKVEVQKGSITAAFREIYGITERGESKKRDKYSHHAIDAAVLTLIPPPSIRDKMLIRYNEAKDKNYYNVYRENPYKWGNYDPSYILEIEDHVLINYQKHDRTLTKTFKNVRKRGKQQYLKIKADNGKWLYKLNSDGNKIRLIAKGDTIRGKLHKESLFGAILMNNKKWLVERYPISSFTSINDCKHIVDERIKNIVSTILQKRMDNGLSFDKAKIEPISFPNGKEIIKKVRCKVAAGRGHLTIEKALIIHKHDFISKHKHKQNIYAQNDENTLCLYYELEVDGKTERGFRIVGLLELAQLGVKNIQEVKNEKYYKSMVVGRNKTELSLSYILKVGCKVILYSSSIEELKELKLHELYKRFYRIYKFNETGTSLIYLQNHLEARSNDILGDGDTKFNADLYQPRLRLVANNFLCAIEGKHFELMINGDVKWLF